MSTVAPARRPSRRSPAAESLRCRVADVAAERAQRVDEVADRPLVHARHAGQLVVAAQHREHRRQRAKRRARVAEEQPARAHRKCAADARARSHAPARRRARSATPSARSASSIRSVSSAASTSTSVVVPRASAASSSVRLEMLFEPGSATVPSACATGGSASCVRERDARTALARLSVGHPGRSALVARRPAARAALPTRAARVLRACEQTPHERRAVACGDRARAQPLAAPSPIRDRFRPAARRGWRARCRATSPASLRRCA